MRSSRTRSLLVTAVVLGCCALAWLYLAPIQIGGSTRYMITHGISMEPMLHTGDLVLVRPSDTYRVGDVVAYRSTLLHTVVLHRVHAIHDGHYTFKGDNNGFLDPTHPTRALLLGQMWLHVPHGGTVLEWVHKPWVAALLVGGVAMLLLFGGDQRRRRRGRGRQASGGARPAQRRAPVVNRNLLAGSATGLVLFAALCVFAFIRPLSGTSTSATAYTQRVAFGYHGSTRPGPVYPNGVVRTGEPIYLQLVHHLTVTTTYQLTTSLPYRLHGSLRLRGTLANTSGWSRSFWLGPPAAITGGRAAASAPIALSRLESLSSRVSSQLGPIGGDYTLTIVPRIKLTGDVAGQTPAAASQASLSLSLGTAQGGGSALAPTAGGTGSSSGLVHTTAGTVTSTHTGRERIAGVPVRTVRWIGIGGVVLFGLLTLLLALRERDRDVDPAERINSRYRHLIVPVSEIHTHPDNPPIEVRTIEALAHLAERSERLILHDHRDHADDYLIDDQGTLFRFRALRPQTPNGNGSGNGKRPHQPSTFAARGTHDPGDVAVETDDPAMTEPVPVAAMTEVAEPEEPSSGQRAAPETEVNGFAPLSDAVQSAEAIRLSSKVTPGLQGPQTRRPPSPTYVHWSQRPEVRVGFTLGPLLTLLAFHRVRSRRAEKRSAERDEQSVSPPFRGRAGDRQAHWGYGPPQWSAGDRRQPQRGPGDRRRGERRRTS